MDSYVKNVKSNIAGVGFVTKYDEFTQSDDESQFISAQQYLSSPPRLQPVYEPLSGMFYKSVSKCLFC